MSSEASEVRLGKRRRGAYSIGFIPHSTLDTPLSKADSESASCRNKQQHQSKYGWDHLENTVTQGDLCSDKTSIKTRSECHQQHPKTKKHRKKHLIPGPAGLWFQRQQEKTSIYHDQLHLHGERQKQISDNSSPRNTQEFSQLSSKQCDHGILGSEANNHASDVRLSRQLPSSVICLDSDSRILRSDVAQTWDCMCLSLERYVVPRLQHTMLFQGLRVSKKKRQSFPNNKFKDNEMERFSYSIVRKCVPEEYTLLYEVLHPSLTFPSYATLPQEHQLCSLPREKCGLIIPQIVLQIENVHCHGHCDWTVELVDDSVMEKNHNTRMNSISGRSTGSSIIGWVEEKFVKEYPMWIRPGVVLFCRNVAIAVFPCTDEDDDQKITFHGDEDDDDWKLESIVNDSKIDRMLLIGEESVVYAWTPEESHDDVTNENFLYLMEKRAAMFSRILHLLDIDPDALETEKNDTDVKRARYKDSASDSRMLKSPRIVSNQRHTQADDCQLDAAHQGYSKESKASDFTQLSNSSMLTVDLTSFDQNTGRRTDSSRDCSENNRKVNQSYLQTTNTQIALPEDPSNQLHQASPNDNSETQTRANPYKKVHKNFCHIPTQSNQSTSERIPARVSPDVTEGSGDRQKVRHAEIIDAPLLNKRSPSVHYDNSLSVTIGDKTASSLVDQSRDSVTAVFTNNCNANNAPNNHCENATHIKSITNHTPSNSSRLINEQGLIIHTDRDDGNKCRNTTRGQSVPSLKTAREQVPQLLDHNCRTKEQSLNECVHDDVTESRNLMERMNAYNKHYVETIPCNTYTRDPKLLSSNRTHEGDNDSPSKKSSVDQVNPINNILLLANDINDCHRRANMSHVELIHKFFVNGLQNGDITTLNRILEDEEDSDEPQRSTSELKRASPSRNKFSYAYMQTELRIEGSDEYCILKNLKKWGELELRGFDEEEC